MNRQPIAEVVGVIKQAKRRFPPPGHLRIDAEAPPRRVSQTAHAFLAVMLVAACRHRKNLLDGSIAVSQQKHLSIEVHFNMPVTRILRLRRTRTHDCVEVFVAKLAGNFPPFVFLKRDQSASPRSITHL